MLRAEMIAATPETRSFSPEIQRVKDKLVSIRRGFAAKRDVKSISRLTNMVNDLVVRIIEKFPDHKDYEAWHALGGSTIVNTESLIDNADQPKIDFPGDFSVEKFVDGLEARMQAEEQK